MIDSHHHLWHYNPEKHQWIDSSMQKLREDFTGEDLNTLASKHGLTGTVLVQVDQSEEESLWLLEQAEKYPIIKGVVGWVDLIADNVEERLAYFSRFDKLKGFRHIAQAESDDFLAGPAFKRGVNYLHRFDFTYDILVYYYQLPAAIKLVESVPDQKFVVDHIAKPNIKAAYIEEWEKNIRSLSERQNVFCKLSGIITEADHGNWNYDQLTPYLDIVLESFGVERLMFGSDWPVCLLAGDYGQVVNIILEFVSQLSANEQSMILSENVRKFYNL